MEPPPLPDPLRRDKEGNISMEDTDENWSRLVYLLWGRSDLEEIFESRERSRREADELVTEDEQYDSDEDDNELDDAEIIEGIIILVTFASLGIFGMILALFKESDPDSQYYIKIAGYYWILLLSCTYLFLICFK